MGLAIKRTEESVTQPYFSYWGKTGRDGGYHLLVFHGLDVAAVGSILLRGRRGLCRRLARAVGLSEPMFRRWAVFFLSLHDIGKFSDAFQGLDPDLQNRLQGKAGGRVYTQRHDSLGYVLWRALGRLAPGEGRPTAVAELSPSAVDDWIQAVTGHHGQPPALREGARPIHPGAHFSQADESAASDYLMAAAELFITEDSGEPEGVTAEMKGIRGTSWWLAGLAVVCDWIGSNAGFFPFREAPLPLDRYWAEHALPNAERAVSASGLLPPKKTAYGGISHLFDHIRTPTPLQDFCHRQAVPSRPQLWILEDLTGSGKTEAALTLVHRLMDAGQGDGVFIGLPTMATANAMYARMALAYRRLYGDSEAPSLILAHSARHLMSSFRRSILSHVHRERGYAPGERPALAQCAAWLADHRKKALLADVGIGSVDQAMLGVLPVRHQSLRLLGLADKVLVINEIHAYDAYMNRVIRTLIQFHASLGGSVILLSATLPGDMRHQFVSAFQAAVGGVPSPTGPSDGYPLVTHVTADGIVETPVPAVGSREVAVRLMHSEAAVFEVIHRAIEAGQCVCWIRNTVSDAREACQALRASADIPETDIQLFHGRFALADRLDIEADILARFGPDGGPTDRRGRIVVATQVVEQSLDLDFDIIISDLAPIDLMIQRAGRQHRHIRGADGRRLKAVGAGDGRPAPVFYILSPEPLDDPPEDWYRALLPRANAVYPHTGCLWRSARILGRLGRIRMPADARALIEGVYGDEAEPLPGSIEEAALKAEGEAMANSDMARFNTLSREGGYSRKRNKVWDEDLRVPTRLGEETVMLHLARAETDRIHPWADGTYPWDMSSLRVYRTRLAGVSPPSSDALAAALSALKTDEPALSEDALVAVLRPDGTGCWGAGGEDGAGRPVTIRYCRETGLSIERDHG